MLNITLDTSIVEINGKSAIISCAIAGVEEVLEQPAISPVPKFTDEKQFREYYFPWDWNLEDNIKPQLLWYEAKTTKNLDGSETNNISFLSKQDLELVQGENVDSNEVKHFYQNRVLEKIKNIQDGLLEIKRDYTVESKPSDIKPTSISIDQDTTIDNNEVHLNLRPRFLSSSIAYFAQQVPPLNQVIQLSFFLKCNEFSIPGNATHFLLYFPIGQYKNDNVATLPIRYPLIDEDKMKFQRYEIQLTKVGDGNPIQLVQPITSLRSYKTDDFIGRLKVAGENYVYLDPANNTTDDKQYEETSFFFNGNTSLIVNEISQLSSVSFQLLQDYSYDKILAKSLIKMLIDYDFTTDERKNKFSQAFTSTILFYAKKLIENLSLQNEILTRNKKIFSDYYKIDPLDIWISDGKLSIFDSDIFEKINVKLLELTADIFWEEKSEKFVERLSERFEILNSAVGELTEKLFFLQLKANKEGVENSMLKRAAENFFKSSPDATDNYSKKFSSDILKLKEKISISDVFTDWSDDKISMVDFPSEISDLQNIDEDKWKTIKEELFIDWDQKIKTPENIAPPINIEVQEINTQTGADLINEISGHIILSRRSKSKAKPNKQNNPKYKEAFEGWKYLNWAKVSLDNGNTYLSGKYLIPAVLPKINGEQTASFHLSNESLSLIAGHDNQTGEDDVNELLNFNYSFVDEKEKNPVPAAPALWYGYHYEFAGFVALNSGALPVAIRGESWNIPKEKINDKKDFTGINRSEYNHLRRVTVGLPNITTDYTNHYPAVPLLVHELVKNNAESVYDDKGSRIEQKKITAFLLCDNENQDQDQLTVTVDKPYTNFWNWYAWMGKDAKDTKIGTDPIFEKALEEELNIKQSSYTHELENRNRNAQSKKVGEKKNIYLWERAVENNLVIKVVQIFPIPTQEITDNLTLTIDSADGESNPANFKIFIGGEKTIEFNKDKKTITIPPGFICKMTIHCRVKKTLFDKEGERMFHSWMKNHVAAKDKNDHLMEEDDYYLTNPEVFYVETAIKNKKIFKTPNPSVKEFTKTLYKAFTPQYIDNSEYGVFCTLKNEEVGFINKLFPYLSRCEVHHQVWRWNGRLFADLKASNTVNLDPDDHISTTEAMKWEAWEFANRPDITALVSNDNITASFELDKEGNATSVKALNQMIFKDQRPKNDSAKAHYFRFGLKIFNRYESIGKGYNESFQAGNYGTTWKRYLKKMLLSPEQNKLPKPAIRFAIPLTDALQVNDEGDNKVRAASMMIATYDRCFVEAGLAERFEVGIEVIENQENNLFFLQAGEDPILSDKNMKALQEPYYFEKSSDGRKFVAFQPVGPAALTFDILANNPKVVGSTFILNVEDIQKMLPAWGKIGAYAMVKVAIRRILKADFVEPVSTDVYNSDWSASEWVQFLPAVDSLIPREWKEVLQNSGYIGIAFDSDNSSIHIGGTMPIFDPSFEDRMDRYLVLSEMINDIEGQPVEKYVGVYKWDSKSSETNLTFVPNDKVSLDMTKKVGYARLMLVRKQKGQSSNENIWAQLFGKQSGESIKFGQIVDDPLAAMPLVTKRILVKI